MAFWDEAADGAARPLQSDTTLCRADGSTVHVTRSIRALHDGGGAAPRHYAGGGAATAAPARAPRTSASRLLAELQATLESTADGILVTDLVGRIRAFNRRFARPGACPRTC